MILKYRNPDGTKAYRPVIFGRPTARAFRTRTACEAYRDRFIQRWWDLQGKVEEPLTWRERFWVWIDRCRDIIRRA